MKSDKENLLTERHLLQRVGGAEASHGLTRSESGLGLGCECGHITIQTRLKSRCGAGGDWAGVSVGALQAQLELTLVGSWGPGVHHTVLHSIAVESFQNKN